MALRTMFTAGNFYPRNVRIAKVLIATLYPCFFLRFSKSQTVEVWRRRYAQITACFFNDSRTIPPCTSCRNWTNTKSSLRSGKASRGHRRQNTLVTPIGRRRNGEFKCSSSAPIEKPFVFYCSCEPNLSHFWLRCGRVSNLAPIPLQGGRMDRSPMYTPTPRIWTLFNVSGLKKWTWFDIHLDSQSLYVKISCLSHRGGRNISGIRFLVILR